MDEKKADYAKLADSLSALPGTLESEPDAILMVSAHWEEPTYSLTGNSAPPMIYDYFGFPEHTYQVSYPAPGNPELADRVNTLLNKKGIASRIDPDRGFDHGMYSPLAVIYPDAAMPVVQLSLKNNLDPQDHLALGAALQPLREENVLIIGSGLSYHNLSAFTASASAPSAEFDQWLTKTVTTLDSDARREALLRWEDAPAARFAHPKEEHLIPLMVAAGAAGDDSGKLAFHQSDFLGGISVSNYRFDSM
ncbi:MAG: dioxygenase [Granulosicoccus sp.]|nr:dioxygenase [Granulosicoccus sp.]